MSYRVKIKFNNTYVNRKALTIEELLVQEFGLFKRDYFWISCTCNREEFLELRSLIGDYIKHEQAHSTVDGWTINIKLVENRKYHLRSFNEHIGYDHVYHLLRGVTSCWKEEDSKLEA